MNKKTVIRLGAIGAAVSAVNTLILLRHIGKSHIESMKLSEAKEIRFLAYLMP